MDLKKFLPNKEKGDVEYFWALVIEPGWVEAGIWRIQGDSAQVVTMSSANAWEMDEDLITAADSALSSAIQDFPEDLTEPSKTVFAVCASWVAEGQIKEDQLEKIKRICKELSLSPVGFVVMGEAISHYYKSEEGSPLNAVVLGIYKESIEASVFKLGTLAGSTEIARSVSIVDDVTEGLTRFKLGDGVPSRFILYDGREGELEEARQALLKVNWGDVGEIKFLHTPKVEIVDPAKKIYAAALAGASEMADVSKVQVVESLGPEEKQEKLGAIEVNQPSFNKDEEVNLEDFGFSEGKDVTPTDRPPSISDTTPEAGQNLESEEHQNVGPVEDVAPRKPRLAFLKKMNLGGFFGNLGAVFGNFFAGLGKRFRFLSATKNALVIGLVVFLALIVGGFAFWWFYPKAVVTIYVSPKQLDEKIEIKVDPSVGSVNTSDRILPGKLEKTTVSGERTKSTTGTKTVGDKAKGEVTIYRVGSQISLSSGTLITGPENLKFNLDESVTVASGSAGTPGNTKAAVTAEDIGAEYNLASGTTFTVSNYSSSDMEAKNESSFSGGSSRDISAVSQDDVDSLEEELVDELSDKAKSGLEETLDGGQMLIAESISTTTKSADFSNAVGDEASTLKLNLDLEAEGLVVDAAQLKDLAMEALKDKIPDGFNLRGDQIEVEFDFREEDGGVYVFDALVNANLLPEVNPDEVAQKLTGKYPKLAEDFLNKELPGFVRAQIKLKPSLPGRLGSLPRVSKNIDVEISAER